MKLLDRYVLRNHAGPFMFGFCVITGVLFLEVFKDFLDEFLAKGVSPLTITEVLALSLGHTLALSIPMAVLVATLMAFGQMAADNEVTALKAAGVHLYRILLPALIAALFFCAGMIVYNDRILPESNHRLAGLTADIARKRPTVDIEPGRFVDQLKGYQLIIGGKDEKTGDVRDVEVYVLRQNRTPDLIVAPRGRITTVDAGNTLQVDLYDGEMHQLPEADAHKEQVYRVTRFTEHTVLIRDVGSQLLRTEREYRSDREMSITMMRASIAEKDTQRAQVMQQFARPAHGLVQKKLDLLDASKRGEYFAKTRPLPAGRLTLGAEDRIRDDVHIQATSLHSYEHEIQSLEVEIQKKYAIPVACVVFVLLGGPLAIRSGKGGMTTAITFSILCFFVYYLFLIGGEKLADRGLLSPFLAMWAANIVFTVLGLVLAWRASIESTPIAWDRLDPRHWLRLLRRGRRPTPAAGSSA